VNAAPVPAETVERPSLSWRLVAYLARAQLGDLNRERYELEAILLRCAVSHGVDIQSVSRGTRRDR
jgi:hypothetical protein